MPPSVSTSEPPPVATSLLSKNAKRAEKIFKKRNAVFDARPVMKRVDMKFLNGHSVVVDCLPDIPADMCHSMRFWLCVKYIESMVAEKRAFKYVRTCYYFGVLLSPVKRIEFQAALG